MAEEAGEKIKTPEKRHLLTRREKAVVAVITASALLAGNQLDPSLGPYAAVGIGAASTILAIGVNEAPEYMKKAWGNIKGKAERARSGIRQSVHNRVLGLGEKIPVIGREVKAAADLRRENTKLNEEKERLSGNVDWLLDRLDEAGVPLEPLYALFEEDQQKGSLADQEGDDSLRMNDAERTARFTAIIDTSSVVRAARVMMSSRVEEAVSSALPPAES